jgi:hypothetical protein
LTAQNAEYYANGDEVIMDKIVSKGHCRSIDEVTSMGNAVRIGVEVAIGLRKSMSKNGIRQMADFVNGMAFAGLLLQKNYRPHEESLSFTDTLDRDLDAFVDLLSGEDFVEYRVEMMVHQIGITDQTPADMLVHAGLSAEDTIKEISEEYNLGTQEVMEMVVVVIALAVAASTPQEKRSVIVQGIKSGVIEKSRLWDKFIPSDEEMFGDDDDEDF